MSKKRSNLIDVGRVSGAFGVKGWVKVTSFTDPKENIVNYSPWWLKTKHGVKSIEVEEYKYRNENLVVRFKGIDDRDHAANISLVNISVERDQMPELAIGDYYWHQLVGMQVIADNGQKEHYIGRVKELMETGANDVLVVEPSENSIDDRERLVPYIPGMYIDHVDLENENIRVLWDPEF